MSNDEIWIRMQIDRCKPFIERAIDRFDEPYDFEHVKTEVLSGKSQLWPSHNSALVTRIETYPDGSKSCLYWLAGGNLSELKNLEKTVSKWAKTKMDCDRVCIIGRRGWLAALDNFKEKQVMLTKEL